MVKIENEPNNESGENEQKDFIKQFDKKGAKDLPHSQDIREALRLHRKSRFLLTLLTRLFLYSSIMFLPSGREFIKDPVKRRFLFTREGDLGSLEDTIIAPDLYHPNAEGTSLEITSAPAGRWVSFDFRRPEKFNLGNYVHQRQLRTGRLALFSLDETNGNNPNEYTSNNLLNIFDLSHLLTLEFPPLNQAINDGFIAESTYAAAYHKVGLYDRYGKLLKLSGLNDSSLYVITPKGNSLIVLMRDGGDHIKKPKETIAVQKVSELKPAF